MEPGCGADSPGTRPAPVPDDGSLWIAQGTDMQAFGVGGQPLLQRTFSESIQALAPDANRQRPTMLALPNPQSNAGLGWEVHFGKLYVPIPPAGLPAEDWLRWPNRDGASSQGLRWLYVAPNSASHFFYPFPGRATGTN